MSQEYWVLFVENNTRALYLSEWWTDRNGQFTVRNVPPGDYAAYAVLKQPFNWHIIVGEKKTMKDRLTRLINRLWFKLGLPEIIWPNPQQRINRELEKDAIKDVMYASLYHRANVEAAALGALDAVGKVL